MNRRDLARLGVSAAVLVATTALARSRLVHPAEHDAFRLVNGLPDPIAAPTTVVMQAGSLPAVFVAGWPARPCSRPALAAVAVAAARVYVGAHLPVDGVGGAAIGVAAGTAARLVSPT